MLRLFTEQEANERAFTALTRFLDTARHAPVARAAAARARPARALVPAEAPLGLRATCRTSTAASSAASSRGSSATSRRPAAPSAARAAPARSRSRPTGFAGSDRLLATPLAAAHDAGLADRGAREALALVTASYEYHGGFRLRTLSREEAVGRGYGSTTTSADRP